MIHRATSLDSFVVGVDGCRAGWIAVARSSAGLVYRIHESFKDLVDSWAHARYIFVDIPIGLPFKASPARSCDIEARRRLGPGRASSVFPAPCRAAVHASSLEQARARNLLELGKSLSAQAWGICPKIAEVDILLSTLPAVRELVKEVHPELSFCALNGSRPMQFSKKRRVGSIERLAVLEQLEPGAPDLIERALRETRRADVGRDDVHDALVAMLTVGAGHDLASPLPEDRQFDENGLPMRMWMPAQRYKSRGS